MNLHFAAVYANNISRGHGQYWDAMTPVQQACRARVEYVLESYHYFNKPQMVEKVRQSGEKIFLDSGAFSAHTQGVSIDLAGYCNFVHQFGDVITYASVLDDIKDPQKTYENQKAMEALGVRALPCFHCGEDVRYLEYYLANYEYITLGGLARVGNAVARPWLDEIWEKYLCDGSGKPRLKVHGFGITSHTLMTRYPWHSIDSASWRLSAVNGQIFHPDMGTIDIGAKRISRKDLNKHFSNFSPPYQQAIREFIHAFGFTVDELGASDLARSVFNMNSYMEINRRAKATTIFVNQQPGIF